MSNILKGGIVHLVLVGVYVIEFSSKDGNFIVEILNLICNVFPYMNLGHVLNVFPCILGSHFSLVVSPEINTLFTTSLYYLIILPLQQTGVTS